MTGPTLVERLKPFPNKLVHQNPSGQGRGSYVKHSVVVQRLLDLFGTYDFELVEIIRGPVKGGDGSSVLCGAVCRLTVVVDGREVRIEEVGDCEQPNNWPHDGARLKDAMSDAIKRCAARLGVGLHLWAQDESYLYEKLMGEG